MIERPADPGWCRPELPTRVPLETFSITACNRSVPGQNNSCTVQVCSWENTEASLAMCDAIAVRPFRSDSFHLGARLGSQIGRRIVLKRIRVTLAILASVNVIFPILAHAQAFVVTAIKNAVRVPACASSANGTAHIICVVGDSNNNLSAVSVQTGQLSFPASPLDPATRNPMPLGIVGFVGDSSCASTADITGDVVCAYASSGKLMGIRFNIFNGTIYPIQDLGMMNTLIPGCTNGSERFTVTGPATREGPAGATVCAVPAGTNLVGIAFNPATGYLKNQTIGSGIVADSEPSCSNSNDGKNQVLCVYRRGGSIRSIAFDPRTSPQFVTAEQAPYPGVDFGQLGHPSCSSPNDGSGNLLCGTNAEGIIYGFALDPRSGYASSLVTVAASTSFTGSTSCSGEGKSTVVPNGVICTIGARDPSATDPNSTEIFGLIFDPRTRSGVGSIAVGPLTIGDPTGQMSEMSCTFENGNPDQIACGGITASQGELVVDLFMR
jgi:hypothetical protein